MRQNLREKLSHGFKILKKTHVRFWGTRFSYKSTSTYEARPNEPKRVLCRGPAVHWWRWRHHFCVIGTMFFFLGSWIFSSLGIFFWDLLFLESWKKVVQSHMMLSWANQKKMLNGKVFHEKKRPKGKGEPQCFRCYCWWKKSGEPVEGKGSFSHYFQGFNTIPGGLFWDFWTINSTLVSDMVVSLNGGTPPNTPKWSFSVGKPMGLLGKPSIFGNPICVVTGVRGASPHPEGYITLDDLKRAVRGGFYGFRLSSQEGTNWTHTTRVLTCFDIWIRMVSEYLLDMFFVP